MKLQVKSKTIISDLHTPVSVFLKVRQRYHQALLLESSDYSSKENSLSFICFDSLDHVKINFEDAPSISSFVEEMNGFLNKYQIEENTQTLPYNGVFGFISYEAIQLFESISLDQEKQRDNIPLLRYDLYKFILVFDHYYEKLIIIENILNDAPSELDSILQMVQGKNDQAFTFKIDGIPEANMTDNEFTSHVTKCKAHCQRGDVFQIVPSRRYKQKFIGDEFNVYRSLRSINPSPYLFYFDYSEYKVFGSSPEAQLIVKDNVAEIHPIAGTFKRTGEFQDDLALANELKEDPKENSEHVMLVDLARNDLSKSLRQVEVKEFKTIQFFSHVIHLVSKLTGKLTDKDSAFQVFADTFPAGTLSGAPKIRAMQIIDSLEPNHRSFYGGGIGAIFFNGNLNHAITIRSFLSIDNFLHYQAGAGIVIDSVEEKELAEVQNKLAALKKALSNAENF